jgi:AAA domain/DnaB-like helicase N terminal domain
MPANNEKPKVDPLPFSDDAEKGVLCSLLLSPRKVGDLCILRLRQSAFYVPAHETLYRLVLEFLDESKPIDFISLKQALQDRRQLEEIGGAEFLNELYGFVPTAANVAYYIDIVLEKHQLRRCKQLCDRLSGQCKDQDADPAALLVEAQNELTEICQSGKGTSRLPAFESFAELSAIELPEPEVIVEGIAHLGSKISIGGASKSNKTWTLVDMGLSVASGHRWLGYQTRKGPVLYVNLELQKPFAKKRIEAVATAKGLPLNGAWQGSFVTWNLRGYCVNSNQLCEEILRRTRGSDHFSLIIIDPLYKILGTAEENSNDQNAALLNLLERVARETGAAIAYGQHFSKGNQASKESIDRVSGAGVYARDPDSILTLTRHKSEGAYTVEATLRNFAPIQPFVVRWEYPCFVRDSALDPTELRQPRKGGRPPKHSVDDLIECLGRRDLSTAEFQKLLQEEKGVGESTFYELLKKGQNLGRLHKCQVDGKWEVLST